MAAERILVTGATGMVGSAVVRRAVETACRVRALVRPASDRRRLDSLGVECAEGDLSRPDSLPRAIDRADVVVHAAGMVGDWGSERLYQQANVSGLRHLLAALAKTGGARRFIHISSLSAYPVRDHFGTDKTEPLAVNNIDPYGSTKAKAELVLADMRRRPGCRS